MYLPKRFQIDSPRDAIELMQKYPLATLISADSQEPFVSHIPLVAQKDGDNITLIGHLARGNPHWKLLANNSVYAIFHGPNAYISPKWYAENDVPTWNYAVVHAQGTCSLIEDLDGILSCVKKLSAFAESKLQDPWEFWIPKDLAADGVIEKSIVGFLIKVTSIKTKFKLNQSRSEADLHGVVEGLKSHGTDVDKEVADLMTVTWKNYNNRNEK